MAKIPNPLTISKIKNRNISYFVKMATGFFYNVPSSMLMIIFIVLLVSISIIGLCLFNLVVSKNFVKTFNDANTALYLSTAAVALSVVLAFIVSS